LTQWGTAMADNSQIAQYPYMFDPSQMSNKYSPYAGVSIPWGSYNGGSTGPTDAHGRPIQSYQDAQTAHNAWAAANPAQMAAPTSLNSNPSLPPKGSPARAMYDAGYGDWSQLDPSLGHSSIPQATGSDGMPAGQTNLGRGVTGTSWQGPGGGQGMPQQQAAPQTQSQQNPYDMNAAYLAALSNPGHVTTPGATVAQSAPPSNQSGVLQQFLANWGGNSKGAGNYDNSGFINSLRGMV
jgi:hypothetical protein